MAKSDSGKPDLTYIMDFPFMYVHLSWIMEFGANKYGSRDNWKKGDVPPSRYVAAALRHIQAWHNGDKLDEESGCSSLAHAICALLIAGELDINDKER
jgi:hypothetical protein